jgi:uncharacterized protein with FMN-binding domain
MKKTVVLILAVAIVGALGVYGKGHSNGTQTANPSSVQSASTNSPKNVSYKDGTYIGSTSATPYGDVQVAVVVSGGRITNVNFLRMPNDVGHSREVTAGSEPLLKQQTLQNQNGHVDFVTGATSTSEGYEQSLQAALNQAA